MRKLNRTDIENILLGCTILGTGGGGPVIEPATAGVSWLERICLMNQTNSLRLHVLPETCAE